MTWQQSLVLGLLAALVALLIQGKLRPALLFSGAVLITYLSGLADINAVVAGYTNSALLTLVLLLLVSLAVEKTRVMSWFANLVGTGSFNKVLVKVWFSTAFLSAFVNNTAVVASMLGAVKRNPNHAPSRLLLPMCFAATFGGVLTLIGTSTNLIVNSFLIKMGAKPLGMFDFFMVGAGTLLTGLIAVLLFARHLPEQDTEMSRESGYFLEAKVGPGSPMAGRSVKENGLRSLKSLYLAELIRGNQVICPVQPEHELHEGDMLLFCGDVESVGVLQELKGLDLYGQHRLNGQHLVEVIVSHSSRLVGQTIKDAEFRTHFDAVVLAVRRGETQLTGGLGQIELHAGDTLLLAPGHKFAGNKSLSREFVVVSGLEASTRLDATRSAAVVAGFLGVLTLSVLDLVPLFKGLLVMLVVLLFSRILTLDEIRRRFPLDIWLVVGGGARHCRSTGEERPGQAHRRLADGGVQRGQSLYRLRGDLSVYPGADGADEQQRGGGPGLSHGIPAGAQHGRFDHAVHSGGAVRGELQLYPALRLSDQPDGLCGGQLQDAGLPQAGPAGLPGLQHRGDRHGAPAVSVLRSDTGGCVKGCLC